MIMAVGALDVPAERPPFVGERFERDRVLERDPLEHLARDGQLMAFRHPGFFQPMDTLRERDLLESLWTSGSAPWRRS